MKQEIGIPGRVGGIGLGMMVVPPPVVRVPPLSVLVAVLVEVVVVSPLVVEVVVVLEEGLYFDGGAARVTWQSAPAGQMSA